MKDVCLVAEFPDAFQEQEDVGNDDGNDAFDVSIDSPTIKRSDNRVIKTGTPGFWLCDILRSLVMVESAVRIKIIPTALANLAHPFIEAISGDSERTLTTHLPTGTRLHL